MGFYVYQVIKWHAAGAKWCHCLYITLLIVQHFILDFMFQLSCLHSIQNTAIWVNGHQIEEGCEDINEEEDIQPLPVDSWEIPQDCIIKCTMLGEGQFGEVYKGLIKGKDMNNPFCKDSGFVAVKILRCELGMCVYLRVYVCVCSA